MLLLLLLNIMKLRINKEKTISSKLTVTNIINPATLPSTLTKKMKLKATTLTLFIFRSRRQYQTKTNKMAGE